MIPAPYNGQRGKILAFINTYRLYIRMKIEVETKTNKIYWVLEYIRERLVEI